MRSSSKLRFRLYSSCLIAALVTVSCTSSELHRTAMSSAGGQRGGFDEVIGQHARTMLDEGRQTFRFDTFGSEAYWGGALQLHRAIAGAKLGGVGPGVSPKTALAVGLKVDATALPATLVEQIKQGKVDLDDPATTVALLKLNAVVGVKGFINEAGRLTSIGLTCAICHSTVDNSISAGIGRRLDGWAARDLNVGVVVSLAPNLQPIADLLRVDVPTVKKVLESWARVASTPCSTRTARPFGPTASRRAP